MDAYEKVGLVKQVAGVAPERAVRAPLPHPARPSRSQSMLAEDSLLVDATEFVRRNWVLLLALGALGAALGLAVAASTTPKFRATATIEIQNINENFLNFKEITPLVPTVDPSSATDVATQLRILRTNVLLERTLGALPPELVPAPRGMAGWIASPSNAKPSLEDRLRNAADNLRLIETRQARIVDLTYDSADAGYAAAFVNTLAQQYMDQSVESRTQLSESTSTFLARQLQEMRDKLAGSQKRLQQYAQQTGLVIHGEDRAPASEKLRQIQTNLSDAEENRVMKQARLETVAAAPAESIDTVGGGTKRDYNKQLADLRRQRADLLAVYQPGYVPVQRLEAQIAALEATLKTETLQIVQDARNEYNDAVRRETLLRDSYMAQTQLVSEEAQSSIQYSMLKNEADSNQRLYEMILQRTAEARVAAAMRAPNARMVDAAKVPSRPYRPSRASNVLWGSTAGLLLGLVAANARERYDRRIKKPGDLGFHLNIPELGRLPAAPAGAGFPLPGSRSIATADDKQAMAVAEACRNILTSILFSDEVARVPQVIVVTSAQPGEGKTTLSTHLAASLARMNRRVLLVDGDLRHPRLHEIFGGNNDYGLSDLLTLQADNHDLISYVAQPTACAGVHLLAAGPPDHRALDMLYSSGTLNLLGHARQEFDTILIDTPSLLELPDARILGRMADGVVLVARAGVTSRDSVLAAKLRLEEDRTALLGTVLNNWSA